ncbi:MAG: hypothetical protein ACR2JC_14195 [Chloroflexota bacterium]|nr:MAG: hypothetical protein DLM70_18730 [Chloroflexota bacterium]
MQQPRVAAVLVLCLIMSALVVDIPSSRGYADQLTSTDLQYAGGPVMARTTSYVIFWLPSGRVYDPSQPGDSAVQRVVVQYLHDVGGSSLYNLLTQYSPSPDRPILNESRFGGMVIDTRPYPHSGTTADPFRDADARAEVSRVATAQGWGTGMTSTFFVLTAPDVQACESSTEATACTFGPEGHLCSWHSSYQRSGRPVLYAVLPYVARLSDCVVESDTASSPSGNLGADAEVSFVSHEQFEMVSDPLGNAWHDAYDMEVADKCQGNYGDVAADGHNVVLHGNPYVIQEEWSNADHRCTLTWSSVPTVVPAPVESTPTVLPQTPGPVLSNTATPPVTPSETIPSSFAGPTAPVTSTPVLMVYKERCPRKRRRVHGRCVKIKRHFG